MFAVNRWQSQDVRGRPQVGECYAYRTTHITKNRIHREPMPLNEAMLLETHFSEDAKSFCHQDVTLYPATVNNELTLYFYFQHRRYGVVWGEFGSLDNMEVKVIIDNNRLIIFDEDGEVCIGEAIQLCENPINSFT